MLRTALALAILATISMASQTPTRAAQDSGYSLELYADLLDVDPNGPGDPFSVRRGSEIRYRIEATVPASDVGRAYFFELPAGTHLIDIEDAEGLTLETEEGPSGTFVTATTTSWFSRVEINARVNNTYQGPVIAVARFRGNGPGDAGPGSSNEAVFQFDHGDGVPGQLVADSFVDMNANLALEPDDVRQSCPVYVYEDLAGTSLPDDISSPLDARLPLASIGQVTFDEAARITLFTGTYSVYFGGCDTPLPPSGLPVTTFELFDEPPISIVTSASGTATFEVQRAEIVSTEITAVTRAVQPIGANATPVALAFDGGALTWIDRADGEDQYRIDITGSIQRAFDLPANSTSLSLAEDLLPSCGAYDLSLAVAAVSRGAGGYPARLKVAGANDCAQVRPPNTGSGRADRKSSSPKWIIVLAGSALAVAAVAVTMLERKPDR